MGKFCRLLCAVIVMVGLFLVTSTGTVLLEKPTPAFAADPVPCGPTTTPPDPGVGFCADYNGDVTWYGTYGPGAAFPNALGFGLCAEPPASGGDFPVPDYDYVVGGAPAGAGGDWNALGFAFSQGSAFGWWGGSPGTFTADQAGAAAKILYDTVVWGSAVPSMDNGVLAAYDAFDGWFNQARGMSDAEPELTTTLSTDSTSFVGSATDVIHMQFPGTNAPLVGQGVLLAVTNGTFSSAGGPTETGGLTDASGNFSATVFADGSAPITVTVDSESAIGLPGLTFYHPTTRELSAQHLATFAAPTTLGAVQTLGANAGTGTPPPTSPPTSPPPATPTGTISVQKAGDDTAYFGLAGAVFQISQGGSVVDTLTTDASGATAASSALAVGTYTVHEASAPAGYEVAPDETVSVVANENTVASFTGANEDHIAPATVTLHKVDGQTSAPLGGAVFDVRYDPGHSGSFSEDLGTCTTGPSGTCSPSGNDGASLLPGDYQVTEVSAPPGYYLNPASAVQTVTLSPGEAGAVTFADFVLGSLTLQKTGDDTAYTSVAGAVFSVTGPDASTANVGTLTVGASGKANTLVGLTPGTYTVTETTAPAGYQSVAPVTVAVSEGSAVTAVNVADKVIPATLQLLKVDRETNAPLGGAVLSLAYDPSGSGMFSQDVGTCTTTDAGSCSPNGNDGSGLLPGDYQVTEVTPPPGYALDPSGSVRTVTLLPGQTGSVTFADNLLVPATFVKSASGNVNPAQLSLAGAIVQVRSGSPTGTDITSCQTNAAGVCTTDSVLVAGTTYCWAEIAAPTGLAGGANGCFTADNAQAAQPVAVNDAGLFVAVAAQKVDATDPAATLPGAVFDLYRVDAGQGPGVVPVAPSDAAVIPGETWVARTTTGSDGLASFPLEFPGFSYCVVEHQAPANYVLNAKPQCTSVLNGLATVPALLNTLTVADTAQTVTVNAHKFNALVPDTDIPGATYDLYVEGSGPPSATPAVPPEGAVVEANDTWYARATTDNEGNLAFTVPAGYAWCLLEQSAPPDYVLDTGLHCTGVLTAAMAAPADSVALPETQGTVHLVAHKFNSMQPDTVIPGATYELLMQGPMPAGFSASTAPSAGDVPAGDSYWGEGTTTAQGLLNFAVPAGYSWCFHELTAPSDYQADPGYHCTAVIDMDSPATASSVALPEVPAPGPHWPLAFTGGPDWKVPLGGVLLILGGVGLLALKRRREAALA